MTSKKEALRWYAIYRNELDELQWKLDMQGETAIPDSVYSSIRDVMYAALGYELMEEFYRKEYTDEFQDWINSLED